MIDWRRFFAAVGVGVLVLVISALLSRAEASAIPLYAPATVALSASSTSGFVTTASATTWSGAAFNSGLTTQVAGKAVTVPATWRLASNAGQLAVNALRVNPYGLAASVALTWLVSYGISKCADGTWCAQPATDSTKAIDGYKWQSFGVSGTFNSGWDAAYAVWDSNYAGRKAAGYTLSSLRDRSSPQNGAPTYAPVWINASGSTIIEGSIVISRVSPVQCAAGYVQSGGSCVGTPVPAGDTDWGKVQPSTIPDAVLNNLAKDGVFLSVSPTVATAPQVVPLSDPYIDPVTGKRFRDVAYVTPSTDGKTADLQVVKQEVDANGNPVTDPATGNPVAPQKNDDPCTGHETRLGCMDKGDIPAGPDLQQSAKTITITPDTGWGPDTMACPADIVTVLHGGGGAVAYSFKAQCDFADGVRAPVIAIAWVAAVLIALGVGSRGGE